MKNIDYKNLSKYDQFYRTIGKPFIDIKIDDFIDDLNDFIESYEKKQASTGEIITRDYFNYYQFVSYYKEKPLWKPYFEDQEGMFLRLLSLDGVFFNRKLIPFDEIENAE